MRQGLDTVERLVYRPTELDADVPSTAEQVRTCDLHQNEERAIIMRPYLRVSRAFALRKVRSRRVLRNLPQLTLYR